MTVSVELTESGDLRMSAEVAQRYFPGDSLVARYEQGDLWLIPLVGPESGGLLLKQRTAAGDRSALVTEALPSDVGAGTRTAHWDDTYGALRVNVR